MDSDDLPDVFYSLDVMVPLIDLDKLLALE